VDFGLVPSEGAAGRTGPLDDHHRPRSGLRRAAQRSHYSGLPAHHQAGGVGS
jgi:hypothetical protein